MPTQQLDRQRAKSAQPFSAQAVTVGDEPLIVDLQLPATPGKHWIVELVSFVATLALRGPSTAGGFPPNSGIFLCQPGTPGESLAEAQAGINMAARPILLPLGIPGANVGTVGASFTWAMTSQAGMKTTVPLGYVLRAIVSCLQGTATPGPGVGSRGTLTVLATLEDDRDPMEC